MVEETSKLAGWERGREKKRARERDSQEEVENKS